MGWPAKQSPFGEPRVEDPLPQQPKIKAKPEGQICTRCGGTMQRTGACYTCTSCGENTGCG